MDDFNQGPIRIGISSCLLGENVRFDGGNKRDSFIKDVLGRYFEWVNVCPEVEAGMGVPREPVRLTGDAAAPRMTGIRTEKDWTEAMNAVAGRRFDDLRESKLSGFIFKSRSPSCGIERIPVYGANAMPAKKGRGLFAAAFMDTFPLIPVEDDGRLNDPRIRENFIVRVFSYHRLQSLLDSHFARARFIRFHTIHKYLLLAHSPKHYAALGRLVAHPARSALNEYARLFMEALRTKSTVKKNVNVLLHILGHMKNQLDAVEKADVLGVIEQYQREMVPLIVPVTLIKHFVKKFQIGYIADQVYLEPHPKELMLRNHV